MILTDLADGEAVFLDANILVYHFAPHPHFGPACHLLIRRIEQHIALRLHLDCRTQRCRTPFDDL